MVLIFMPANDYAIQWASGNGHLDVVRYLAEKNANISRSDLCNTMGHWKWDILNVVRYLAEKKTPIFHAADDLQ